jgi:hypothetical protein
MVQYLTEVKVKVSKGVKLMSQDKELTCKDCGQSFTFTAGEQEFFQTRGFSEPIRCKTCRDVRKSQKSDRGFGGGGGGQDRGRDW